MSAACLPKPGETSVTLKQLAAFGSLSPKERATGVVAASLEHLGREPSIAELRAAAREQRALADAFDDIVDARVSAIVSRLNSALDNVPPSEPATVDAFAERYGEQLYRKLASASIGRLNALVWFATKRGPKPSTRLCLRLYEDGLAYADDRLTLDGRYIIDHMIKNNLVPVKAQNAYGMPKVSTAVTAP